MSLPCNLLVKASHRPALIQVERKLTAHLGRNLIHIQRQEELFVPIFGNCHSLPSGHNTSYPFPIKIHSPAQPKVSNHYGIGSKSRKSPSKSGLWKKVLWYSSLDKAAQVQLFQSRDLLTKQTTYLFPSPSLPPSKSNLLDYIESEWHQRTLLLKRGRRHVIVIDHSNSLPCYLLSDSPTLRRKGANLIVLFSENDFIYICRLLLLSGLMTFPLRNLSFPYEMDHILSWVAFPASSWVVFPIIESWAQRSFSFQTVIAPCSQRFWFCKN